MVDIEQEKKSLEDKFCFLKETTLRAIETIRIKVEVLVDKIYKLFSDASEPESDVICLHEIANYLRSSNTTRIVFDHLSFHWDYLHPDLYGDLIQAFNLCEVNPNLTALFEKYKASLDRFIDNTPLKEFCKILKTEKSPKLFAEVEKVIVKSQWEEPVTLRKVETLRQETALRCKLQQCAVVVVEIVTGCYMTTMVVPASVQSNFRSLARDRDYIDTHEIIAIFFHDELLFSRHLKGSQFYPQQGIV